MRTTTSFALALGVLLAAAVNVRAQDASQAPDQDQAVQARKVVAERTLVATQAKVLDDLKLRAAASGMLGSVVTGAPYSAVTVNESIQTLPDGNRIVQRSTFNVARDGQGRVRREELDANGQPVSVMIMDPVANVSYTLDPADRTARKMALLRVEGGTPAGGEAGSVRVFSQSVGGLEPAKGGIAKSNVFVYSTRIGGDGKPSDAKQESLGVQAIEGVPADGTRTVTTIPAGQIGNERPIDIVFEQWYSKDLQMTISSRHSDPRMGETTYRVTNLRRGEPDASLFQVPADYTLKADSPQKVIREFTTIR